MWVAVLCATFCNFKQHSFEQLTLRSWVYYKLCKAHCLELSILSCWLYWIGISEHYDQLSILSSSVYWAQLSSWVYWAVELLNTELSFVCKRRLTVRGHLLPTPAGQIVAAIWAGGWVGRQYISQDETLWAPVYCVGCLFLNFGHLIIFLSS